MREFLRCETIYFKTGKILANWASWLPYCSSEVQRMAGSMGVAEMTEVGLETWAGFGHVVGGTWGGRVRKNTVAGAWKKTRMRCSWEVRRWAP